MQIVKFNEDVIKVLKNFQTINPSIYLKKGNVITTKSDGNYIFARYENTDMPAFETDFAIYKLGKFISLLSFFDDPEVEIHDKFLLVKSGKHEARMLLCDPSAIPYPKKDNVAFPPVNIEVSVTANHINAIKKSFAVMELPEVAFIGDGETISLAAINHKEEHGDSYKIDVGLTDKTFQAIFNVNHLEIIPADYDVSISSKGIARFKNDKLMYCIAVEKDSKF